MSKQPYIVIGGSAYADIDVLACTAAYKQFLDLQGHTAHALITGPWNQTIPLSIKNWKIDVEKEFLYSKEKCNFILVDFSDPNYVNDFVNIGDVVKVFDHHYGYEDYWKEKIGSCAKIERVGACATLIWEEFKSAKIEDKISPVNANLLFTAIFANTLDFKSAVTHLRDRIAAEELRPYTNLPADWQKQYYSEIEEEFMQNALKHILDDTKRITFLENPFNFGQIELQNASPFLQKSRDKLTELGSRYDGSNQKEHWLINIVSIEENCSYLYCNDSQLQNILKGITLATSNNTTENLMVTSRLWLRKELLKELMILEESKSL